MEQTANHQELEARENIEPSPRTEVVSPPVPAENVGGEKPGLEPSGDCAAAAPATAVNPAVGRTARSDPSVSPAQSGGTGFAADGFGNIYAIGDLRAVFPSNSVQQEFNQIVGRMGSEAPDSELLFDVLSQGQYLYLSREVCWVLQIQGVDAYIVRPRTYVELNLMIEYLEPDPGKVRYAVVIGPKGLIAGPEECAGLQLPIVYNNQFYYFTFQQFITRIIAEGKVSEPAARSMFEQMLQLADNAGDTDEHRAINYVTLRYPGIYEMAADMLDKNKSGGSYSLQGVVARPADVQGSRRIIDVVFNYAERATSEIVNWYCRVDVSGQFPFLISRLSRYYPAP